LKFEKKFVNFEWKLERSVADSIALIKENKGIVDMILSEAQSTTIGFTRAHITLSM